MRIWVAGSAGRLGSQLLRVLSQQHDVIGQDIATLDITDFAAVRAFAQDWQPQVVINAAAWTDVDGCARNPEKAILVNGLGAQNLALAAFAVDAAIIQISSNEVFNGKAQRPYYEYDRPDPVNPYGYSKFAGEQAVREGNPRHYIVRTSWLFAHGGKNFIHAILKAARSNKPLRVVVDEVANPTYNNDLADALAQLLTSGRYGTYHLCNEGPVSRYGLARYALNQAGFEAMPVERISIHEWPRPSHPPLYTGMTNLAAKSLGIVLRPWQKAVDAFLEKEGLLIKRQAQ